MDFRGASPVERSKFSTSENSKSSLGRKDRIPETNPSLPTIRLSMWGSGMEEFDRL